MGGWVGGAAGEKSVMVYFWMAASSKMIDLTWELCTVVITER